MYVCKLRRHCTQKKGYGPNALTQLLHLKEIYKLLFYVANEAAAVMHDTFRMCLTIKYNQSMSSISKQAAD